MQSIGALDPASTLYTRSLLNAVLAETGEDLIGLYLYGSAATGPFLSGQSDLDALLVVRDWLGLERVRALIERVRRLQRPTAFKGLDLWTIPLSSTLTPRADPAFECWLLTTIGSELMGGPEHPGDARLVLLYAMCREHGLAVAGPSPAAVFGPLEREWLIDAMRVDLALTGASGWYRVLNACRTLHFLEEGTMCGKLHGAAWARDRVPDPSLVDDAVTWRRLGSGPPLRPERVDDFVADVARRLTEASPTAVPAGTPAVEHRPRIVVLDERPLVTCVLVAPPNPERIALATRCFLQQTWSERELLVLGPPGGPHEASLPLDARVRAVGAAPEDADGYLRELALREASGALIAAWDASTWYAPDRLSQQISELLSTSTPRLVTPHLIAYDPITRTAKRVRELELLERTTLCARRDAWTDAGGPARFGERSEIAVLVEVSATTNGAEPAPAGLVQGLLGDALDAYVVVTATASSPGAWLPAVSCLMPTYNRRRFAERAIAFFLQQDYPNRQLIILDDGEEPIADLVAELNGGAPPIRYHRLSTRQTIGRKRELACELADGDLLVQWDDDDWYGPARLSRQIAPLAAGSADIAGILQGYLFDVTTLRFWKGGSPVHEGHLHASIVSGTLAFTRPAWRSAGGYPDQSSGEEVALLRSVLDCGGRVAPIVNDGIYICVRHPSNSWRWRFDAATGPPGWSEVPPPDFLPWSDVEFYHSLRRPYAAA